MKLTEEQLKNIIKQELKEAYGNLGPDDETEDDPFARGPDENDLDDANRSREFDREHTYTMNKKKFIKGQYINWVEEFDSGMPEELEKIVEVLGEAYDKLGEAFELDDTGLYE